MTMLSRVKGGNCSVRLPPEFCSTPNLYSRSIRKSGTGYKTRIYDHLYEGRFTPTNADGKRISRNIYAQTREECEEKLAVLIVEMKAEIKAEKERRKQAASA